MTDVLPPRTAALPQLRRRGPTLLVAALLVAYAITVLRFAWVGDDAFITLRTVDNVGRGFGLTWNVDERVQAYTHPLWMLLLVVGHLLTRELYFTTIAVGVLVSTATAVLFARRVAPTPAAAALGLALLCSSRAFIDYSTSGLENPLTHLLLLAFWLVWTSAAPPVTRLFGLALCAGLAACNRMDTALLFLPPLLVEAAKQRDRRGVLAVAAGFLPFVAWEAFAVVYYGFPFPNTAYAKLNTGIAPRRLWIQGLRYVRDTFVRDPITLGAVAAALVAVVGRRRWRELPFVAGLLLYVVYVIRIGGDFMSGRFFTGPFLLACVLLSQVEVKGVGPLVARLGLVALLAVPSKLAGWLDGDLPAKKGDLIVDGIADERRYYTPHFGLWTVLRDRGALAKIPAPNRGPKRVLLSGAVGFEGLAAGPDAYLIDVLALTDPFLARLPCHQTWRIGHYGRVVPFGYWETVETGKNHLLDPKLQELYAKIALVTRGPIGSPQRWTEIWRLNRGAYRDLVDRDFYANPPRAERTLGQLARHAAPHARWDAEGNLLLHRNGARIRLEGRRHEARVALALACGNRYRLAFFAGEQRVAEREVDARKDCKPRRLAERTVDLAPSPAAEGYDALTITPIEENGQSSLGALRLE